MSFKINFKIINHQSFSVTDEDDGEYIRCIVDPVYGDTIEVGRPTTHLRKSDNKILSETMPKKHAWCATVVVENVFIPCSVLTIILASSQYMNPETSFSYPS